MPDLRSAALQYVKCGLAVFPVSREKVPLIKDWPNQASTDPDVIDFWWNKYPNANIGIACGEKSGGLQVIDIDVHPENGKDGRKSIMDFQSRSGTLPETVTCITGTGGMHLYYIDHGKFRNSVELLPGVDLRTDGGYVVAPPSIHANGKPYAWANGSPAEKEITHTNATVRALLNLSARLPETEEREHKPMNVANVETGHRNDTLFKYVSLQRGAGVPIDIARGSAHQINDGYANPLPASEVDKIVESAYKRYQPNEDTIYTRKEEDPVDPNDIDIPTLEEYEEQDVEWLIPGYLPKEQITMICGTGGTGKTSVWASLLASISSGKRTLFDGTEFSPERKPMTVMFFSSEDTVENVIKKKLREQKAVMRNVRTISLSDPRFEKIKFGSKYLEETLKKFRPALCVFDPLQAFIDPRIKMSDRNAMRQNMRSLIEWGKLYGTTFLIVMHTNKQSNVWGRGRMADSADLWDIARCVWMVGDADDNGLKYLSHEKSNYGKTGKTMLFRNDGGHPTFEGWTDRKDRDYVLESTRKRNADKEGSGVNDCCNAILSELADHPEGYDVKELDSLMHAVGYGSWIVRSAKAMLKDGCKITYFRDGMNGPWKVRKNM
jgi:hypothetical protein